MICADLAADIIIIATGRDQFLTGWHIDPVDIGKPHRWRCRCKIYLIRTCLLGHLYNLSAGCSPHDRVIHQQHILTPKLHTHRVEFLPDGFTTLLLTRHDECSADITVLNETLSEVKSESVGKLQCTRSARVWNWNDHVDIQMTHILGDLIGKALTHIQPSLIDRDTIHHRIGTG